MIDWPTYNALRETADGESLSYGELAQIEAAFTLIPDEQLRDQRENATADDMLDEIAAFLSTRRPLVIIGVGGGLVQWYVLKPGTGLPRLHVLDYDREGQGGDELGGFVDEIEAARADLAGYADLADDATLAAMVDSINEYEQMIQNDETARDWR